MTWKVSPSAWPAQFDLHISPQTAWSTAASFAAIHPLSCHAINRSVSPDWPVTVHCVPEMLRAGELIQLHALMGPSSNSILGVIQLLLLLLSPPSLWPDLFSRLSQSLIISAETLMMANDYVGKHVHIRQASKLTDMQTNPIFIAKFSWGSSVKSFLKATESMYINTTKLHTSTTTPTSIAANVEYIFISAQVTLSLVMGDTDYWRHQS